MRHRRRRTGGYGAEMHAANGALVIRCCLCDWSRESAPIESHTERELATEWFEHRLREHRSEAVR